MKTIIGTWPLSGDFGRVGLARIAETLHACVDAGFVEFDTAPNYGDGFMEACLGREVAHREGVTIHTKVGNRPFRGKSFEVADLQQSVEDSLRRLRVEQIGILFLHNPRAEVSDWEPIFQWLSSLKRQGTIRSAGISLAARFEYDPALLSRFDVVQDDASLLSLKSPMLGGDVDAAFVARSPLASGLLGGHIGTDTVFADDDHRAGWLKGERLASLVRRIEVLRAFGDRPLPRLARQFLRSHPAIDRIICGVKSAEHVAELARSEQDPKLSRGAVAELTQLWERDFGLVGERHLGY